MSSAQHNLSIILRAAEIEGEDRPATPAERDFLSGYTGWGSLAQTLHDDQDGRSPIYQQLSQVLSPDALRSLRRTILDAFFTPPEIVHAIWHGLERMGFRGGRVLESSFGVGAFLQHAPASLREHLRVTAVEKDHTTCRIARLIHPDVTLVERAFEDVALTNGAFDVTIGNPPYADLPVFDPAHPELRDSIHAFMVAKAMLKVRPGGLGGFVVSRFLLDGTGKARAWLQKNTRLVAAFRLPAEAFRSAQVEVMTDVVFLQRCDATTESNADAWNAREPMYVQGVSIPVNRYFLDHPEALIGQASADTDRYGNPCLALEPSAQGWAADLLAAVSALPEGQYTDAFAQERSEVDPSIEAEDRHGQRTRVYGYSFDTRTGAPVQRLADHADELCWRWAAEVAPSQYPRLRSLLGLRDTLRTLLDAESGRLSLDVEALRAELNQRYAAHVRAFKALHSAGNRNLFSTDPDYSFLLGLELNYDPGVTAAAAEKNDDVARPPSWTRADILSRRVVHPDAPSDRVDSAEGALVASLRNKGHVSIDYMASVSGLSTTEIKARLAGEIFPTRTTGRWVTRAEYLSGNVVAKLEHARRLAAQDPQFELNVEALESVQPARIEAQDIHAPLGAAWIPGAVVAAFVQHLCGHAPKEEPVYVAGTWVIEMPDPWRIPHATNNSLWGTAQRPFVRLFPRVLNQRSLKVTVEMPDGTHIPDMEATQAAEEKASALRDAWADWLWTDADRRAQLTDRYNSLFNTHVPRTFDGAFLLDADGTLPGSSRQFVYDPHQINAAWRMVCERGTLVDHVVGSGKTLTAITGAMLGKRTGRIRKPMFVVPGHLVGQWADEFVRAFPTARVLALAETEFSGEKRSRAFARIALNEWDAVIVPHSSFGFIDMPAHKKVAILDEMMAEVEEAITLAKAAQNGDRLTLRQLERIKARVEERVRRLTTGMRKDGAVFFEDMGVDALIVDEFHKSFKNLMYFTEHHNVGGLGSPEGSMRALDLFVKARWLADNNRSLTLLSGTPISNSVVELFTVLRLLAYDDLQQKRITGFDAWASTFAVPTVGYELSATGHYQIKTRFRSFNNVPELMRLYRSYADVVHTEDLRATCEAAGKEWGTPALRTGKPIMVLAERSPLQSALMDTILERAERLSQVDPQVDNALKLFTDAGKIALDPRLYVATDDDFAGSKINLCVRNVVTEYQRWSAQRGTQLIFCDSGTPKPQAPEQFTVYADLRHKLIAHGIPANEIAFIHDANTPRRKHDLFRAMRSGSVRVLLGTTAKMGEGMNVQTRLVAIHDLDAPFRPSDIEQRLGRIVRRGNELRDSVPGFEVSAYRYGTRLTLDAMRWQILETKSRFISQIRKGTLAERSISDVDAEDTDSGFAAMKAELSGNPLILEHFQVSERLKRLDNLRRAHRRETWHAESSIQALADFEQKRDRALEALAADRATLARFPELTFQASSGADALTGTDMNPVLSQRISAALSGPSGALRRGVAIGWFSGFALTLSSQSGLTLHFSLDGDYLSHAFTYTSGETIALSGLKRRISNALAQLESMEAEIHHRAERNAADLAQYRKIAASAFPHSEEIQDLRARLHTLEAALANAPKTTPTATTAPACVDDEPPAPVADASTPAVRVLSPHTVTVHADISGFRVTVSRRIARPAQAA